MELREKRNGNPVFRLNRFMIETYGRNFMNERCVAALKPFNGYVLEDLLTAISIDANAILALGALLQTADLGENFGKEWKESRKYREGLNRIIEIYHGHQERQLGQIQKLYESSPEGIINEAVQGIKTIKTRGFNSLDDVLEEIGKHRGNLQGILNSFKDEYPMAEDLLNELAELEELFSNHVHSMKKAG